MKKTIRLTEQQLREMVEDTVKMLTAGGEGEDQAMEPELDPAAFMCKKKCGIITEYLTQQSKNFKSLYKKTRNKLFSKMAFTIDSCCDKFKFFMEDNGYDDYMRKKDKEF
jgi:hypothetical protein